MFTLRPYVRLVTCSATRPSTSWTSRQRTGRTSYPQSHSPERTSSFFKILRTRRNRTWTHFIIWKMILRYVCTTPLHSTYKLCANMLNSMQGVNYVILCFILLLRSTMKTWKRRRRTRKPDWSMSTRRRDRFLTTWKRRPMMSAKSKLKRPGNFILLHFNQMCFIGIFWSPNTVVTHKFWTLFRRHRHPLFSLISHPIQKIWALLLLELLILA